ncbi:MAG: desulfoferrodoxin family protein [Acidocella sp.]|nr:desulfoferrodoxin family protein [Acidocella sp.]
MQRRQLASRALAGAAIAAALPAAASAAEKKHYENIIFTTDNPGHWANVVSLHVPDVTVDGSTLTIKTPHPMSEAHYIVSHTVVLEDGKFLDRKTFTPADQPVSTHTLPTGYKGRVLVTSTCNLHDFWVKPVTI